MERGKKQTQFTRKKIKRTFCTSTHPKKYSKQKWNTKNPDDETN